MQWKKFIRRTVTSQYYTGYVYNRYCTVAWDHWSITTLLWEQNPSGYCKSQTNSYALRVAVFSQASTHRHSQTKHQTLRVGSCMEEVITWKIQLSPRMCPPQMQVSCCGLPNQPPIVLESGLTCSLITKLPQHSLLAVRKFCAVGEEHC